MSSVVAAAVLASLGIIDKNLPEDHNDNYIGIGSDPYNESLSNAGYTLEQKRGILEHDDAYLAGAVMSAGTRSNRMFKRDEHLQEVNFSVDMGTNTVNGILSRDFENDDGDKVYNHAIIEDLRTNPYLNDVRAHISGLFSDD